MMVPFFGSSGDMEPKIKRQENHGVMQQRIQQFHRIVIQPGAQLNLRVLITAAKTPPEKIQAAD